MIGRPTLPCLAVVLYCCARNFQHTPVLLRLAYAQVTRTRRVYVLRGTCTANHCVRYTGLCHILTPLSPDMHFRFNWCCVWMVLPQLGWHLLKDDLNRQAGLETSSRRRSGAILHAQSMRNINYAKLHYARFSGTFRPGAFLAEVLLEQAGNNRRRLEALDHHGFTSSGWSFERLEFCFQQNAAAKLFLP
jgi:hypothetical protein